MAFDIDAAKKSGYSDSEIADFLGRQSKFDVEGARKAGYSDGELITHLTKATPQAAPASTPQGKPNYSPAMLPVAGAETAANMASGFVGRVAGDVAGLGAMGLDAITGAKGRFNPVDIKNKVQNALTYEPRSDAGKLVAEYNPLALLAKGFDWAGTQVGNALGEQDARYGLGVQALGQGAHEAINQAPQFLGAYGAPPVVRFVGGKIVDAPFSANAARLKAANIARDAAGPDLPAVRAALASAPGDITAAQATSGINSPVWQALNARVAASDPRFYGPGMTPPQIAAAKNKLAALSGGEMQTAMLDAQKASKNALNEQLIPVLNTELNAANTAGQLKPKLDAEAQRMAAAAASKVEDVRRFTAAGERAGEKAANTHVLTPDGTPIRGSPLVPGRYTYAAELEKAAERVSQQAADASLPFGEASRFAQAASDSLAAHGLKPLTVDSIQLGIKEVSQKPEFAGNKDITAGPGKLGTVMQRVSDDIAQWTDNHGVIDAKALDSIRKNSVNGIVKELNPNMDVKAQKQLASGILSKVTPLIVDAMENAGGTGYRKYLEDYSAGRQKIDQTKMAAVASDLFNKNPQGFVDLVKGNAPDAVEAVFGSGKYDLAKQMDPAAMQTLRGIADVAEKSLKAKDQAQLGANALNMKTGSFNDYIPNMLNPKVTETKKIIAGLENKLGQKAMNNLIEGLKSGAPAGDLLNFLPAKERVNALKALSDPSIRGYFGLPLANRAQQQ